MRESCTACLYSIDQGGQPITINPVTLQGSAVKMSMPGIGGSLRGKAGSGRQLHHGHLEPGAQSSAVEPEARHRRNRLGHSGTAAAAENDGRRCRPRSLKSPRSSRARPTGPARRSGSRGRQFSTINTTLNDLITFAYGIHAKQISGGPGWLESEKFDLAAQPNGEGQPNDKQWKGMVQKLLADRFQLAFHRDKKELSVYAIVVGKDGPKLTKNEGNPNGLPGLFFRGLGVLPATNATMADFAGVMQGAVLDRPVVDQTGLTGRWDFTLTWTPDEFQFGGLGARMPPPANDAAAPPDLFTAFQEQLGLKLESTKAPAEVFVIDRVEKPSEN